MLSTQADCQSQGGQYMGDGTVCTPGLCSNDTCPGAIAILRCTTGTIGGTTATAANDYDPGAQGCTGFVAAGKDVVYYVDLNAGDIVNLTYTQFNYDASFYIVLDCQDMNTCVAGADNTLTGEPEVIHYAAAGAARYFVILDSFGQGAGGDFTLDFAIECPQSSPGAGAR